MLALLPAVQDRQISNVNVSVHPADKDAMLALSIRQPYAELILRGIKTVASLI